MLQLFRVLVPSWRFFDELGDINRLYYRYGADRDRLGKWMGYSEEPKRNPGTLFLNPRGNLHLANIALLSDLPATSPLIGNLVRLKIAEVEKGRFFYQFKTEDFESQIGSS
jgi:hypothetical protein